MQARIVFTIKESNRVFADNAEAVRIMGKKQLLLLFEVFSANALTGPNEAVHAKSEHP